MSTSANVTSVPELERFRAAFAEFQETTREVLSAAAMEIARTVQEIDHRLKGWQVTKNKRERELATAKIELNRKKIARVFGHKPDITAEEAAVRKAQARLEHAEEKIEKCRRWLRNLPQYIREYEGPSRQLSTALEIEVTKALAVLERRLEALEAYLQTAVASPVSAGPAPATSAAPPAPAGEGGGATTEGTP